MLEYYMFHKPKGCVSACSDERHKTVMDYFPKEMRDEFFHVGRLDRDTEGLLLITNDGKLCYELMKPEHKVAKTYFFYAQGVLSPDMIAKIESGINIYTHKDFETAPAKITVTETKTLREIKEHLSGKDTRVENRRGDMAVVGGYITVTEGKKHQVKRMIRYAGCRVVYLKRIKIGELSLDESLLPGEYRPLTSEELSLLKK